MKFTDAFIRNLGPSDKMYQLREGDVSGILEMS
jgi:hypothetical protein